jgi:hypothetical protein
MARTDFVERSPLAREALARGRRFGGDDRAKIEHYEASLEMLLRELPGHFVVDRLSAELDALHTPPGVP